MSIGICGYHDKPICKECNACEDCGKDACIHTKRGRITRQVFTKAIEVKGVLEYTDVIEAKLEIERLIN